MEWTIVIFVLTLIFNAGVMYKTFKDKPSKEAVYSMIDEKMEGHCLFSNKIEELEKNKEENEKEKSITHLILQELRINIKRLCEHSGIDYLNGNNK